MNQNLPQVKVIVVGDSGVGKSSILYRFVNDEFNEFSEATLGAAFISKEHTFGEQKCIRFQIWDTAGQQKYKSIAPIYYRDSQIALCVYDITKKQSFGVLKTWVEELKTKGPENILLAVIGNKIDLAEKEEVSYTEAKDYAEKAGAMFKLTSAKQGNGINELFTAVAERLEDQKNASQYKKQTARQKNGNVPLTNGVNKPQKTKCCGGSTKKK